MGSKLFMNTADGLPNILQKILLFCGLLAPLLNLGMDRLAGKLLKGYSFEAQSISELSAYGSPTRSLVISFTLVANALMIGFGVGIFRTAGQGLFPQVVGGLVIGNAAAGLVATIFFPTQFGERPNFLSANVIIMFLGVVFFVLAMVFGAVAFKGWFRILSIIIPVSYVLLAMIRFATPTASNAEAVVSLVGAQERTMSYSFLIWVMALAIHLLLSFSKGGNSAGL